MEFCCSTYQFVAMKHNFTISKYIEFERLNVFSCTTYVFWDKYQINGRFKSYLRLLLEFVRSTGTRMTIKIGLNTDLLRFKYRYIFRVSNEF